MKDLTEVRDTLTKLYADLQSGAVGTQVAKEMNKTATNVIETFKLELRYGK